MKEVERVESIKRNGGYHLKKFKEENITYAMCLAAVESDGEALCFVPDKFKTEEVYKLACKSNGSVLYRVPDNLKTKEICEQAVSSYGLSIEDVPEKFKTRELYLLAACNDPSVMQRMPTKYFTVDFCLDVIKVYGYTTICSIPKEYKKGAFYLSVVENVPEVIWHIPKNGRTVAVCKAAIKSLGYETTAEAIKAKPSLMRQLHPSLYDHETCLTFVQSEYFEKETAIVPNRVKVGYNYECAESDLQREIEQWYSLERMLQWKDVCNIAVRHLPLCIPHIKEDVLTYEMCFTAVKKSTQAFKYVPSEFKQKDICMLAFEKKAANLCWFPEKFITYELWLAGVKRDAGLLSHVPRKLRNYEIGLEAVKSQGRMIECIPHDVLDEEMCLIALKNMGEYKYEILNRIPERLRTYQVCLIAVKANLINFKYIPEEHRTYELYLTAITMGYYVKGYGGAYDMLKSIPEEYFTEELCFASLKRYITYLWTIPKTKRTEQVCLFALRHSGMDYKKTFKEIPEEILTQKMCNIAIEKSISMLPSIPEKFITKEILVRVWSEQLGYLAYYFPERLRTKEFIDELIKIRPDGKQYLETYLRKLK